MREKTGNERINSAKKKLTRENGRGLSGALAVDSRASLVEP